MGPRSFMLCENPPKFLDSEEIFLTPKRFLRLDQVLK